jgi:imidazolonepropionase-like amidohydrolase
MRAVKKAIDAGLSPADAIRALTLSPAEIFGVDNRLGSIDKGKIADLVVVDGDIFAGAKVKYVFVDGNKFEPPDEPAGGGRGGRGGATIPGLNQGGSAQ